MGAPVLLPALLVGFGAERFFLALADGLAAVRAHAIPRQLVANGGSPAVAQRQIVFGRAALVAVAFNRKSQIRVLLQELRRGSERLRYLRAQAEAVVIEEHVLHLASKHLLFCLADRGHGGFHGDACRGILRSSSAF